MNVVLFSNEIMEKSGCSSYIQKRFIYTSLSLLVNNFIEKR